jgi:hypothetical protein
MPCTKGQVMVLFLEYTGQQEMSNAKLFFLSFPWLYPLGIGDIKEYRKHKIDTAEWAENSFLGRQKICRR